MNARKRLRTIMQNYKKKMKQLEADLELRLKVEIHELNEKGIKTYIHKDSKVYQITFEKGGKVKKPLKEIGKCKEDETGSTVRFKADPEIFKEGTEYNYQTLYDRIRQMAFLNKDIRLVFNWEKDDERKGTYEFLYEGGIKEYVKYLNESEKVLFEDVLYVDGQDNDTQISVEVALQYNTSYNERVYSFCNNILLLSRQSLELLNYL